MRNFIIFLLVFILLFGGIFLYIGNAIADKVAMPFTRLDIKENTDKILAMAGFDEKDFLSKYKRQTLTMPLEKGDLPIEFFPSKNPRGTILLVHPIGFDARLSYLLVPSFLEIGLQVISYDQRGAGSNPEDYYTLGKKESEELVQVLDFVKDYLNGQPLYVWGVSTGATTICLGLKDSLGEQVSGIILDSPWYDGKEVIKEVLHKEGPPIPESLLLKAGSLVSKKKYGFSYDDLDISDGTKKYYGRVLFFASKKDEIIPYSQLEYIYQSFPGKDVKLVTVEDSQHGQILIDHPLSYGKEIGLFTFGDQLSKAKSFVDATLGDGVSEKLEKHLDTGIKDIENYMKEEGLDLEKILERIGDK